MSGPDGSSGYESLLRFAVRCLRAAGYFDGEPGMIFCDDVMADAKELGIIRDVEVREPCGDDCTCYVVHEDTMRDGVFCPRLAEWFLEDMRKLEIDHAR